MTKFEFLDRTSTITAAAVAGYVALILVAAFLTWDAFAAVSDQRASVAAAESMLAQLEGRSFGRGENDSPFGNAPAGSAFLEGHTLNVAGAALLQRVASAVRGYGGNILSSQVELNTPRAKAGWIDVVVSCDVEEPAVQQIVYNLESGMPFLFVDQLDVQAPTVGLSQRRMRILMSVSGQWWAGK